MFINQLNNFIVWKALVPGIGFQGSWDPRGDPGDLEGKPF